MRSKNKCNRKTGSLESGSETVILPLTTAWFEKPVISNLSTAEEKGND